MVEGEPFPTIGFKNHSNTSPPLQPRKCFRYIEKPQKPYSSIISYTRPPHSLDNGGGKRCTYQFSCIPCNTTLNNGYNIPLGHHPVDVSLNGRTTSLFFLSILLCPSLHLFLLTCSFYLSYAQRKRGMTHLFIISVTQIST